MKWPQWEFKFNLTTVTVLGGFLVSIVLWYSVVNAHLQDVGMHNVGNLEERQASMRREVAQQLAPVQVEVNNLVKSTDKLAEAVLDLQKVAVRLEETMRYQRTRDKEEEFRNWSARSRDSRGGSNERP